MKKKLFIFIMQISSHAHCIYKEAGAVTSTLVVALYSINRGLLVSSRNLCKKNRVKISTESRDKYGNLFLFTLKMFTQICSHKILNNTVYLKGMGISWQRKRLFLFKPFCDEKEIVSYSRYIFRSIYPSFT